MNGEVILDPMILPIDREDAATLAGSSTSLQSGHICAYQSNSDTTLLSPNFPRLPPPEDQDRQTARKPGSDGRPPLDPERSPCESSFAGSFINDGVFAIHFLEAGTYSLRVFQKDGSRIVFIDERDEMVSGTVDEELNDVEDEKKRVKMDIMSPEDRIKNFCEVELGFSEEKAHEESKRCLRCDLEK